MSAYSRGSHSGGAYSFGATVGALAIVSASTVTVAGDKVKNAAFEIFSTSSVGIAASKITSSSVAINDVSVVTVSGGLDAVGGVDFVSFSNCTVQYNRVFSSSASIVEASSLAVAARKKWETEADVSESWTVVSV